MDAAKALVFYILREKSEDISKDFPNLIYDIRNAYVFVDVIESSPRSVTLSGDASYKSELEYLTTDKPEKFSDYSFCAKLTITQEDYLTFNKLRQFLSRHHYEYRIYSNQLHSYLPGDSDLVNLEFGSVNLKTFEALKKFSLIPIYFSQKNRNYYAINLTDKKVHLVNPHLLEFIFNKTIPETTMPELSYPVAPDLNLFSAMYDKHLIPTDFYEYYQKSTKVINKSNFDIDNPGRKVFVKPYILEFIDKNGEFYTYAGPEGASMLLMSKILRGETLETCLLRVLKEELGIAEDFIGAFVAHDIEFDRDREGRLTPRLVVFVYVDKIINKDRALQMSQTGWRSVDGKIPNITPITSQK
jgi:hypothetical protein